MSEPDPRPVEEVYRSLIELAPGDPDRADVPLHLYWLLALHPELDPTRTRHTWLAEALTRARLGGAAAELYRRELAADPVAATKGPYERLLAADAAPDNVMTVMTVARWRLAAAEAGQWHVVTNDFELLAGRLRTENESGWLQHVAGVLGWVAWERNEPLYTRCREEVAGLRHLESRAGHLFDQLDELEVLAGRWRDAYSWDQWPTELLDAVRAGWTAGAGGAPRRMASAVRVLAANPARMLSQLDRLNDSVNRPVLVVFGQLLTEYARPVRSGPTYPPGMARALAREFLGRQRGTPYHLLRPALLTFLAEEVIDPAELADACAADPDRDGRALAENVRPDAVLRWVWLALRQHAG